MLTIRLVRDVIYQLPDGATCYKDEEIEIVIVDSLHDREEAP